RRRRLESSGGPCATRYLSAPTCPYKFFQRISSASIFLPSPGDLPVDASLDLHQRPRIASKLHVVWLQKILPHHREVQAFRKTPSQPHISRLISAHPFRRRCAHVAICRAEVKSFWQTQQRLEHHGVLRARS